MTRNVSRLYLMGKLCCPACGEKIRSQRKILATPDFVCVPCKRYWTLEELKYTKLPVTQEERNDGIRLVPQARTSGT